MPSGRAAAQGPTGPGRELFWAMEILPGNAYSQTPPYDLHITQVALDAKAKDNSRNSLQVTVEGGTFTLGTLQLGKMEHFNTSIVFDADEEITFHITGKDPVHVIGYYMHDDGDMYDVEIDSEGEDSEEEVGGIEFDSDEMGDEEGSEEDGEAEAEQAAIEAAKKKMNKDKLKQQANNPAKQKQEAPKQQPKSESAPAKKPTDQAQKKQQQQPNAQAQTPKQKETQQAAAKQTQEQQTANNKRKPEQGEEGPAKKKKKKHAQQGTPEAKQQSQPNTPKTPGQNTSAPKSSAPNTPAPKTPEAGDKSGKKKKQAQPATPASQSGTPLKQEHRRTLPNGLQIIDRVIGDGVPTKPGKLVHVKYVGKLENGKIFDSSLTKPFKFRLGQGSVIKGWDMGVQGMRVGGKRTLIIPPALAYGAQGAPPDIPPHATLTFDIEVVDSS